LTGQKQRSGGARRGSGPHRRRIRLDPETALTLAVLTKHRQALNPAMTEEQLVKDLIQAAGHEQDEYYQEASELAAEDSD
jgi:hypothetical protein